MYTERQRGRLSCERLKSMFVLRWCLEAKKYKRKKDCISRIYMGFVITSSFFQKKATSVVKGQLFTSCLIPVLLLYEPFVLRQVPWIPCVSITSCWSWCPAFWLVIQIKWPQIQTISLNVWQQQELNNYWLLSLKPLHLLTFQTQRLRSDKGKSQGWGKLQFTGNR